MSSKQGKNIKGELKVEGNLILSGITEDDSPLKILYYGNNGNISQGLTVMRYISEDYVNDDLVVPITIGDITVGTHINTLTGKTFSEILNLMLVPTLDPYISQDNVLILELTSSINDIVEVGTPIAPTINATYNRGTITFGNNVDQIDLTGLPSTYRFKLPNGNTDTFGTYSTTNLTQQHTYNSYPATLGTITWSVEVDHNAGTGNYYNSKKQISTILDSERVSGTIINSSDITIFTSMYIWWDINNEPNDSNDVRSMINKEFIGIDGKLSIIIDDSIISDGDIIYFCSPTDRKTEILEVSYVPTRWTNDVFIKNLYINDPNNDTHEYNIYSIFFTSGEIWEINIKNN